MITYLYVKTHNVTGLKYFGKTIRSDYIKYRGSGKYWLRHIKKYGDDISTELYYKSDNLKDIEDKAIKFSKDNNIVESNQWANLKYENGKDGGSQSEWISEETRKKMSLNRRGKPSWTGLRHTRETIDRFSKERVGRRWWNNGIIEKKQHTQPEGFVRGRLPNKCPCGWNRKKIHD